MTNQQTITLGKNDVTQVQVNNDYPMVLIAGPCAIESRECVMQVAEKLVDITKKLDIPFVFKASFDKANRTSTNSKRGVGITDGLKILEEVRTKFNVPVITDIHNENHVQQVANSVDVLQIPAFLCRQADLLQSAAETGLPTNIKKGQFLAPENMKAVVDNFANMGNSNILQCERGATFGYNNLVSDMKALDIMKTNGYPVIMDATHSVQMPGGQGTSSGGRREFVETIARSALSTGIAGLFLEIHPDPRVAISDGPNQIPLDKAEALLTNLKAIDEVAKRYPNLGLQ